MVMKTTMESKTMYSYMCRENHIHFLYCKKTSTKGGSTLIFISDYLFLVSTILSIMSWFPPKAFANIRAPFKQFEKQKFTVFTVFYQVFQPNCCRKQLFWPKRVFLSTINVVNVITPPLNRIETKENGPIRIVKQSKETKTAKERVLTVYKPMQSRVECKQSIETAINSEVAKDLSNSKISRVYVQANY